MQHQIWLFYSTMSNMILSMKLSQTSLKKKAPNQKGKGLNNKKGPEKASTSTNPQMGGIIGLESWK